MQSLKTIEHQGHYHIGSSLVTTTICGLMQIPAYSLLTVHTEVIHGLQNDFRKANNALQAIMRDCTQEHA
jgi:hypothetical protein